MTQPKGSLFPLLLAEGDPNWLTGCLREWRLVFPDVSSLLFSLTQSRCQRDRHSDRCCLPTGTVSAVPPPPYIRSLGAWTLSLSPLPILAPCPPAQLISWPDSPSPGHQRRRLSPVTPPDPSAVVVCFRPRPLTLEIDHVNLVCGDGFLVASCLAGKVPVSDGTGGVGRGKGAHR